MIPTFLRRTWRGFRRKLLPVTLEISFNPRNEDPMVTRFERIVPGDHVALTDGQDGWEWISIRIC